MQNHLTYFSNRFQASFFHLLVSLLITGAVVGICVWLWYPLEFVTATGVAKIFMLVIIVDACLGPILTLLVYDKKKEQLKRDLVIILIIQLAALTYGVYTLANARTVYMVFAVDRFELVQANELAAENLDNATQERFKTLPWLGPQWIATKIPDDPEERMQVSMDTLAGGSDIAQLPKYYQDISSVRKEISERSKNLDELQLSAEAIAKFKNNHAGQSLGFLPLTARKKDLSVIVDRNTSEVIEIIDVDPW